MNRWLCCLAVAGVFLTPLANADIEDLASTEALLTAKREGTMLTLEEAVRLAILQSLDIKIIDLDQKVKAEEIRKAHSVYDATFKTSFKYDHDSEQNASTIAGSREITGNFDVSLDKKLITGTDLTVSLEHERNSTDSLFSSLNPSYRAVGKVTVAQPILRNAFGFLDRADVKRVKIDVDHFSYETRNRIEETFEEVLRAYWELVLAYETFDARLDALRRAKEFWVMTSDKFSFGLAEKPDLLAAEANVRNRIREALMTQHVLENDISQLRILLNLEEQNALIPNQKPELTEIEGSLTASLVKAFSHRRDYAQAKLDIELSELAVKMKKNSLWPELDLEGSYASNALDKNVADAEGEAFNFNHPAYTAGATFTVSLENREARAEYHQAEFEKEKKLLRFKKLEQEIYRDIDNAWRRLQMAKERAKQSNLVKALHQEILDEEAKNFRQGRSNTKIIIDYQDDLIEAKLQAVRDLVDFQEARLELLRRENTLLRHLGIGV